MQSTPSARPARVLAVALSLAAFLPAGACASPQAQQQNQQKPSQPAPAGQATPAAQPAQARPVTPTDTVREFSRALRERRLRDALSLTILKPAVEGLSAEEFEDMRPEMEKLIPVVREQADINGEQISGDTATVFARLSNERGAALEPVALTREGAGWLIGERESYEQVRREGKEFLFRARVETHHDEVQKVLVKIANAEAAYAAQHAGAYADLPALAQSQMAIRIGLKEDLDALQTLGYRVSFSAAKPELGYRVGAEPVRYGRTGRLSFYMDKNGIQSKDTGGKPYNAKPIKKP